MTWMKQTTVSIALIRQPGKGGTCSMVKVSGEAHFTDDLVPVIVLAGCAVQLERSSYRDRDRFI